MDMSVVNSLFHHVEQNYPEIWDKILNIIHPHRIESIKRMLHCHLKRKSISLIKTDEIANFLLDFCQFLQYPEAGDPFGILLTCRITQRLTQTLLDGRHLQNVQDNTASYNNAASYNSNDIHTKLLLKQINTFTELNQIFEMSHGQYFQFFTTDSLENRLGKEESCRLINNSLGVRADGSLVYLNTMKFIIMPSFIKGINRVIYRRRDSIPYLFRNIPNILALTDIKYVYLKCGIAAFFFNFLQVTKLQFFKKTGALESRDELDILFVLKYMCLSGAPLPMNRNGMKKNANRSALEKLCFEAVKQTSIDEAILAKTYPVKDSMSKMYFGQPFNEGTGYQFELLL